MTDEHPQTGPRHEPGRTYERAPDPAEAVDRPLEPKAPGDELAERDEPGPLSGQDPHHRLNTPAGEVDPDADSDPYRKPGPQDEADRASGTTGSGQGAER